MAEKVKGSAESGVRLSREQVEELLAFYTRSQDVVWNYRYVADAVTKAFPAMARHYLELLDERETNLLAAQYDRVEAQAETLTRIVEKLGAENAELRDALIQFVRVISGGPMTLGECAAQALAALAKAGRAPGGPHDGDARERWNSGRR